DAAPAHPLRRKAGREDTEDVAGEEQSVGGPVEPDVALVQVEELRPVDEGQAGGIDLTGGGFAGDRRAGRRQTDAGSQRAFGARQLLRRGTGGGEGECGDDEEGGSL